MLRCLKNSTRSNDILVKLFQSGKLKYYYEKDNDRITYISSTLNSEYEEWTNSYSFHLVRLRRERENACNFYFIENCNYLCIVKKIES